MIYYSVACGRGAVAMATQSLTGARWGRRGGRQINPGRPNALPTHIHTHTAMQRVIKITKETLCRDLLIRLWRAELEISGAGPH